MMIEYIISILPFGDGLTLALKNRYNFENYIKWRKYVKSFK